MGIESLRRALPSPPRPAPSVIVVADAEIDIATAPALLDQIMGAALEAATSVVVDFAGVTFVDAAALNMLVVARNLLPTDGAGILVRSPTPRLIWMLELFGLADRIEPCSEFGGTDVAC